MAASEDGNWHTGVYTRFQRRPMKAKSDRRAKSRLESVHIDAVVGYDLNRWLTVYGVFGGHSLEQKVLDIDGLEDEYAGHFRDWAFEFGAGIWANLLHQDILDAWQLGDAHLTLNAGLQWTHSQGFRLNSYDSDFTWDEFSGQLTAGFGFANLGNKNLWPHSVALYFGPSFNYVHSDMFKQNFDDVLGAVVGVDFALAKRTMLSVATEFYRRTDWRTSRDRYSNGVSNSDKGTIFTVTAGLTMGF